MSHIELVVNGTEVYDSGQATTRIDVMSSPYNAVGNGSNDDTAAINAAANAVRAAATTYETPELYFPPGRTYRITGQLNLLGIYAIECQAHIKVDYVPAFGVPSIIVGTPSYIDSTWIRGAAKINIQTIFHTSLAYNTKSQPDIRIMGCKGSEIRIGKCDYVELYGDSTQGSTYNSIAYNNFHFGEVWRIEIRDDDLGTGEMPWINENKFWGGDAEILRIAVGPVRAITNVVNNGSGACRVTATGHNYATGEAVEVKFVEGATGANGFFQIDVINANTFDLRGSTFGGGYTTGGLCWGPGTYGCNHNLFWGGTFEGQTQIHIAKGNHNRLLNARLETSVSRNVMFGTNTWGNYVEQTCTVSGEIDLFNQLHAVITDFGNNITGWDHFKHQIHVPLFELASSTQMANGAADIPGYNGSGITPGLDYMTVAANQTIWVSPMIKVQKKDIFWLDFGWTTIWRYSIQVFDANQRVMTGADPNYPPRLYMFVDGGAYNSTTGVYSCNQDQVQSVMAMVLTDEAKFIRISILSGPNGPYNFRNIGIYQIQWKDQGLLSEEKPMYGRQGKVTPFVSAVPSSGFARLGFRAQKNDASESYSCTFSFETTLSAGAAQNATTLNVVSNTGVLADDIIGVLLDDGTTHWTTVVSTGVLTIDLNAGLASAAANHSRVVVNRWATETANGGGGGAAPREITTATANVLAADSSIIVNYAGTCTLTFPDPSTIAGKRFRIKTITANLVNSASANIVPIEGGAASTNLLSAVDGNWADIDSDGVSSYIICGTAQGTQGPEGTPGAAGNIDEVANLSALKALASRPPSVYMRGRSTAGDGGEGMFFWDGSDTTTPGNDGFVVEPGAGVAGRWKRAMPDRRVNVMWFGCTGRASDIATVAVRAAADAIRAVGHSEPGIPPYSKYAWDNLTLFFPAGGVFVMADAINPIDLTGIWRIECEGWFNWWGPQPNGPCIIIGAGSQEQGAHYHFYGMYDLSNPAWTARWPMVQFKGMRGGWMDVGPANCYIELYGSNDDPAYYNSAWNEFHLGQCFRFEIRDDASARNAWLNENSFFQGDLTQLRIAGPWRDITNVANNGSGGIRVTTQQNHGLNYGEMVEVFMSGIPEAEGFWIAEIINVNSFDLQGATWVSGTYTSGGVCCGPPGYPHNGNVFWQTDIEDSVAIVNISGICNKIVNSRIESNRATSRLGFGAYTYGNTVEGVNMFSGDLDIFNEIHLTTKDFGIGNYTGWAHWQYQHRQPIIEFTTSTPCLDGRTDLYGWQEPNLTPGLRKMTVASSQTLWISPLIKVQQGDIIWMVTENDAAMWRPTVKAFDINQNWINVGETSWPPRINWDLMAQGLHNYDSATGVYSSVADINVNFFGLVRDSEVKYIQITIATGSNGPYTFEKFAIYHYSRKQGGNYAPVSQAYDRVPSVVPTVTASPTKGFVRKNFRAYADDNTGVWRCTFELQTSIYNNAAQNATVISVEGNTGVLADDIIGILMNNGLTHWSKVDATGAGTITIHDGMPAAADYRNRVVLNRWAKASF